MEETAYSSDSSSWNETISCNNVYDTKQENNQFMPRGFRLQSPNNVYLIERVLGHGSFGITYLARCNGKYVALKEFFMEKFCSRNRETFEVIGFNPGNLVEYYGRKFQQEATHLRKLKHDNIIQVFEAFWANHTYYYSMEYVDGCSLDAFLKRNGAMKESEAIECMQSVLNAIEYLHSQKMLHLDLKPGNIMRRNDGHYNVIDFGLSKQFNEEGEPESSSTIGLGTKGYAPTEQGGHNGNNFAPWIDVYALGGCFFKMLTGNTPPDSSEVLNDGLPIDELKNKKISKATIKLIKAMMEPMWKNRIQDVSSVIKRLPQIRKKTTEKQIGLTDSKEESAGTVIFNIFLFAIPFVWFFVFVGKALESILFDDVWDNSNWGSLILGLLLSIKPYIDYRSSSHKIIYKGELIILTVLFSYLWFINDEKNEWSNPNPVWSSYKNRIKNVGEINYTVGKVKFRMMPVNPGTFIMGKDNYQDSAGLTMSDYYFPHEVTITKPYYIGETEVTQGLWKAVMGQYHNSNWNYDDDHVHSNQPVREVSYDEAMVFIEKLNIILNVHFRLPTEAEWEYAAKGGEHGWNGYKYSGSNDISEVAWYRGNCRYSYNKVAKKKNNQLGLYDMSGSVSEWCSDWSENYKDSAQTDPTGPSSGTHRVIRGGGYYSSAGECTVYRRDEAKPDEANLDIGFRLAL